MAATGFIIPASVDLTAIIGADFSTTINLYTDVAQTTAFDLTGYTATMKIGDVFSLTSGAGLTITPATGTIGVALTAAQVTGTLPNTLHYTLKLVDGSGVVSYPLNGKLSFQAP